MLDDDIFESERNEKPKANITFNMAQNTTHNIAQNTTYNYNTVPWVEKYRPKKINNVVKQNEVVKVLTKTLETGHMPNLLFYGPPGIGKTTTILAAVAQMFGPDKIEERVIELNASDDRGINVVRDTIIAFAKQYYGENYDNMTLILNASEERGIETVRLRVKPFVTTQGNNEQDK